MSVLNNYCHVINPKLVYLVVCTALLNSKVAIYINVKLVTEWENYKHCIGLLFHEFTMNLEILAKYFFCEKLQNEPFYNIAI